MAWLRTLFHGPGLRTARLEQLRAEMAAIWPEDKRNEAPPDVRKVLEATDQFDLSWDTVLGAEMDLLRNLSLESLKLKHANLRDELTALAGGTAAAAYLSRLAEPSDCSEERVRAEAADLAAQAQKLRILRQGFNRVRTSVTVMGTTFVVIFSFALLILYFVLTTRPEISIPVASTMIVLFGALGGCVSALARLYSVTWTGELAHGVENFSHMFGSLVLNFLLAMVEGGVFAVLLYLAFMGNFVSGALFPGFGAEAELKSFFDYVEAGLSSHRDFAKALVWSFVAGFSERLVPDFIRSVGGQLNISKTR